jgi:hypothetical protein
MFENVGASTSHNPKGLHGHRDNFTFLPYMSNSLVGESAWKACEASVKGHPDICFTFRVNNMVRNYIKYPQRKPEYHIGQATEV